MDDRTSRKIVMGTLQLFEANQPIENIKEVIVVLFPEQHNE